MEDQRISVIVSAVSFFGGSRVNKRWGPERGVKAVQSPAPPSGSEQGPKVEPGGGARRWSRYRDGNRIQRGESWRGVNGLL